MRPRASAVALVEQDDAIGRRVEEPAEPRRASRAGSSVEDHGRFAGGIAASFPIEKVALPHVELSGFIWLDWRIEVGHVLWEVNRAMDRGIVDLPSKHPVDETVERLKALLEAKGIRIFALIDHSGEAEKAGLRMPPTKLVIFGSPKAGTPLMLAAPSTALDLPLKILVWQDATGRSWVSFNDPEYLRDRHGFPAELSQNIAAVATLAAAASDA